MREIVLEHSSPTLLTRLTSCYQSCEDASKLYVYVREGLITAHYSIPSQVPNLCAGCDAAHCDPSCILFAFEPWTVCAVLAGLFVNSPFERHYTNAGALSISDRNATSFRIAAGEFLS